ncbi:hypothetical protein QUB72_07795 [Enterococcus faecium]|nr:hypothetical protein [Enterococcus faecium]
MMLEIIFICFVLYTYILYTRNNFNVNIFTTLYSNKENMFGSGVIGYGRNLISAFSIAIIVGYGIIEEDKKISIKRY